MMSTKPFYQSQTITGGIAAGLLATIPVAVDVIKEGRLPTEAETYKLLGFAAIINQIIRGRLNAKDTIGQPVPEVTTNGPAFTNSPIDQSLVANFPVGMTNSPQLDQSAATDLPTTQPIDQSLVANFPELDPTTEEAVIDQAEDSEELDVDLNLKTGRYTVKALQKTKVKSSTEDSTTLADEDLYVLTQGQSFQVDAWSLAEGSHIKVTIRAKHYFLFAPHIELRNLKGESVTLIQPTLDRDPGIILTLPGHGAVGTNDPIYEGSHFTWGEALRNGERRPYEKAQVDNIIAIAKELDKIREMFSDRPILITSWLRPDRPIDINAQVGGARNSQHIRGHAVDFYVVGLDIWEVQKRMQRYWTKGGLGLGASRGFIHIDLGTPRVWDY